jgi:hypothetical protein
MDKPLKRHLQELRREARSFHRSQLEKMAQHDAMRQAYFFARGVFSSARIMVQHSDYSVLNGANDLVIPTL